MNLVKTKGLLVSEKVLKHLRANKHFKKMEGTVHVGTFTNCREVGLTYMAESKGGKYFTWCTYEHRNSDSIILNGKTGFVTNLGDLPYKSDSKWDYIAEFGPGCEEECSRKLAAEIIKFVRTI